MRVRVLIWGLILSSLGFLAYQRFASEDLHAESSPAGAGYTRLNTRSGVWNDGQAALWDLNFLDHFHYFGPKERAKGHRPEQPIKFSHISHVLNSKIECQFCHWNVAKSPYATIPEVEVCQGCHKMVPGTSPEQQEEIKKVTAYFDRGEQIAWQKVHVMPDYVRFNHKRHVKAGVGCHECHGQVPLMQVVERVSSMKMGWCMSCHRERGASIDCYVCHK